MAERRRAKTPKLVACPDLAAHVTRRLENEKASPQTIARDLMRGGATVRVSHETIYHVLVAATT